MANLYSTRLVRSTTLYLHIQYITCSIPFMRFKVKAVEEVAIFIEIRMRIAELCLDI